MIRSKINNYGNIYYLVGKHSYMRKKAFIPLFRELKDYAESPDACDTFQIGDNHECEIEV